ncbi:MAG: porin family protein [Raineya sp.]|nr:porin family protein [Raineya sp.]
MKKCFVFVISFAVVWAVHAQDYGIRVGPNASMVLGGDKNLFHTFDKDNNEITTQPKIGFNVGFYARFQMSEHLFFRPEIGYSAKGFANKKAVYQYIDAKVYRYDFNYLDFTPLLQLGNHEYGMHMFLGPQVGYLLQSRRRLENEYGKIENIIGKKPNRLAVGAVVGLGYEFAWGLNWALRAEYNITPIASGVSANILALQGMVGFNLSSINVYRRTHRNR